MTALAEIYSHVDGGTHDRHGLPTRDMDDSAARGKTDKHGEDKVYTVTRHSCFGFRWVIGTPRL